ncbi:hypothetical protein D3C78_1473800 [compost metagenome]
MAVPVDFLPQAEFDLIEHVPFERHVPLLEAIIERLGRYPEIGVRLEPPDDFARAHGFGDWEVYWEPIYAADNMVGRVEVLRLVPNVYARVALFP